MLTLTLYLQKIKNKRENKLKQSLLFMILTSSRKEVILGCNKNYTKLAFDCTFKNLKETILALRIDGKCRNNNIENK